MELLIFLGIIAAIIFYVITIYNTIIRLIEEVNNNDNQIAIQLDRRGKLFDSLISTVKEAMNYEKTALKEIIELREKEKELSNQNNPEGLKQVENEISSILSSGKFRSSFNLTVEAYPELKANTNMLHFQEEIVTTENKLSYAKKRLNDSIERYYTKIKSFPDNIIVGKFPSLNKNFEYWTISDEVIKQEEDRRASF